MTHSTGANLSLLACTLLCACASGLSFNSNTEQAQTRTSAVLIAQSNDNLLKLQQGAATLLNIAQIELAPEAFTRVNRVLLERRPFQDGQGHPLMGRSLELPTVLLLERLGEDCYLRLEHSEQHILIPGLSCRDVGP